MHVGSDAIESLRSTESDSKAGDHLIEDKDDSLAGGLFAEHRKKVGVAGTSPILAAIGSKITAAISSLLRITSRHVVISLKGRQSVCLTEPAGTPFEEASGLSWITPEPALTSKLSWCPWKWPMNLMITDLPVAPLATRSALIVASVPDETKRIFSMEGMCEQIFEASCSSYGVAIQKSILAEADRRRL